MISSLAACKVDMALIVTLDTRLVDLLDEWLAKLEESDVSLLLFDELVVDELLRVSVWDGE